MLPKKSQAKCLISDSGAYFWSRGEGWGGIENFEIAFCSVLSGILTFFFSFEMFILHILVIKRIEFVMSENNIFFLIYIASKTHTSSYTLRRTSRAPI